MEQMGFNKKPVTWQEQYRKRKKVGSRPIAISKKADRLKLVMKEIREQPNEDKSSSKSELSASSEKQSSSNEERILDTNKPKEEKKYQDEIAKQLEALIRGDTSIFSIYDPLKRPETNLVE